MKFLRAILLLVACFTMSLSMAQDSLDVEFLDRPNITPEDYSPEAEKYFLRPDDYSTDDLRKIQDRYEGKNPKDLPAVEQVTDSPQLDGAPFPKVGNADERMREQRRREMEQQFDEGEPNPKLANRVGGPALDDPEFESKQALEVMANEVDPWEFPCGAPCGGKITDGVPDPHVITIQPPCKEERCAPTVILLKFGEPKFEPYEEEK